MLPNNYLLVFVRGWVLFFSLYLRREFRQLLLKHLNHLGKVNLAWRQLKYLLLFFRDKLSWVDFILLVRVPFSLPIAQILVLIVVIVELVQVFFV